MSAVLDWLAIIILWLTIALWVFSCCYAIYAVKNDLLEGFAGPCIALAIVGFVVVVIWALYRVDMRKDVPLRIEAHQVEP